MQHKDDLLGIFAKHKVAPNLLMAMMILAGVIALNKLNVQFFPTFDLDIISVSTTWTGASSEDVERAITIPLEQRLRNVDHLKEMTSSSASGVSGITLEFDEGTDMLLALDQVRKQVDDFTSLPQDAELPRVSQTVRYEAVARILISGPDSQDDLRKLARQFEQQLLDRGIDKIELMGLPEESIMVSVPSQQMYNLGLSLQEIGERIDQASQDLPAGLVGENDATRELRSLNQRRDPTSFEDLPVVGGQDQRINLGDIAQIERGIKSGSETITLDGKPAVALILQRSESGDSLE